MYDVTALGELLIDFTPLGESPAGQPLYEANPGGAPANVLAALSRLGGRGAFLGKVGDDRFGRFLAQALTKYGIDPVGLRYSPDVPTTLAFVHLNRHGDRSFSFYRHPGADTTLTPKEVDLRLIEEGRIFHFGSLSLTDEPARGATLHAAAYAKARGKIVSYDPNWRPPLWPSDEAARQGMEAGLPYADLLKLSGEELTFLTGLTDPTEGARVMFSRGIALVIATLGPQGCYYHCAAGAGRLPTYDTPVIDTTGAGDAFLGALLYRLSALDQPLARIEKAAIEEMLDFANAAGALCAAKRGAMPAMPGPAEVEDCQRRLPKRQ